jgi:uncharacterized protein YjiS (DUF1127 family)
MDLRAIHQGRLELNPGEVLRLRDATGRHLGVLHGAVWITQYGDVRDAVVESGASFRFERDGVSLVQALGGVAMIVLEAGLVPESAPRRAAGSAVAFARPPASSVELYEAARRLRAEATGAILAVLAAGAGRGLKRLGAALARGFAAARDALSAPRDLRSVSDHFLHDVGLRRDQVHLAGRAQPCVHC